VRVAVALPVELDVGNESFGELNDALRLGTNGRLSAAWVDPSDHAGKLVNRRASAVWLAGNVRTIGRVMLRLRWSGHLCRKSSSV
jgi:hypothetical protein